MSVFFTIVMVVSGLILLGWMMIPIAIIMLDLEEAESWNADTNDRTERQPPGCAQDGTQTT